jgi:hypothetical protein
LTLDDKSDDKTSERWCGLAGVVGAETVEKNKEK